MWLSSISCTWGHDLAPGLGLCPPAQEPLKNDRFTKPRNKMFIFNTNFVRLSSIPCSRGHDLALGLVLYPLLNKSSRMGVSMLLRTTFAHVVFPRPLSGFGLGFVSPAQKSLENDRCNTVSNDVRPFCVIPAHEPLQSTPFQYSFERLSSSSCTQGQCAQA